MKTNSRNGIRDAATQRNIQNTASQLINFRNNYSHRNHPIDVYTCENAISSMRWLISVFPEISNEKTGRLFITEANAICGEYYQKQQPANPNIAPPKAPSAAYAEAFAPVQTNASQGVLKRKNKLKYIILTGALIIAILFVIAAVLIGTTIANTVSNPPHRTIDEAITETIPEDSGSNSLPGSGSDEGESNVQNGGFQDLSQFQSILNSFSQPQSSSDSETPSRSGTSQIPQEYQSLLRASDVNWTEHLQVGDTHISSYVSNVSKMWSNFHGYSEDTSIAVVGEDNIVTAKAPGTVRILYVGQFMGNDQTYIVEYTVTN